MPGTHPKNLTRDEAATRAAPLSVSSYTVQLDLTSSPDTFHSVSTVTFTAAAGASTFIDFIGPSVEAITLNGRSLDPATQYDGFRVALPDLAADNVLTVDATACYMNTGEGLHRFVDPVDDEVYLYTQFEVADSRRMYAVFEQPDLKACFTFEVTAPSYWRIISNQPTPEPIPLGTRDWHRGDGAVASTDVARWEFSPTPPLSSYITALMAGPYAGATGEVVTADAVIPLGVYCRASLLPSLEAEAMMDVTRRGFAFFEKEFGLPYPFAKYDQIFTPEYNMGAMENAGAVTFNEVYVFRAKVTDSLVERRALTILHELAHMWFGDLVTMRWWDDLWLNESFAEWASTVCQAEATRWETSWTTFATAEKAWAYSQDQLSSTHPIAADIRHLEDVQVNFDGITYAKGASVLKQLVAYVGREPFVQGLRSYFRTHAWGNTTLADLLSELSRTSGRDLDRWSTLWLESAGVNTLRVHVSSDEDGLLTSVEIEQTAAESHPTLRPHRLRVGLYDLLGGELIRRESVELDVDGARTPVPALVGRPRPDVLLVNDEDLAYAKIRLDEQSLAALVAHPEARMDSLPRALLLGALWDMTRDAELPARHFVEVALASLPQVKDSTLLRILLGQIQTCLQLYSSPLVRPELAARVAARLRGLAQAAAPGSDAQLQLLTVFAAVAVADADIDWLDGLLDASAVLPGLSVDTEMRWTLVTALAANGRVDEARILAERAADNTSTGRERAARALAARPTAEAKAQAWEAAVVQDGLPNQTIDALWQGFGRAREDSLLTPYIPRYHDAILGVWQSRTPAIAESIVEGFYPTRLAAPSLLEATQGWLSSHPDAPDGLVRLVSENRDIVKRALAAQSCDARATIT